MTAMKKESKKIVVSIFGKAASSLIKDMETEPDLAKIIEECSVDRIWARKKLPLREKSLITLASQVALGRWDQVKLHSQSFLHLGGTREELKEIFIHLGNYCGFPATVAAFQILKQIE